MKTNRKLPYGISDFGDLHTQNYFYVDRTQYIKELENLSSKYVALLRPRRFGKSLFVSMLQYYYGLEYKEQFQELFGKYYIGQNPTPLANQYMVIKFNFAQINTKTILTTEEGFIQNVKTGVEDFFTTYAQFFKEKDLAYLLKLKSAVFIFQKLRSLIKRDAPNQKLYILIDEYDHFANEVMAFRIYDYKTSVSENGFVRKFYEALKAGTTDIVDRIFITGVTPITLDSMTSGFNIKSDITRHSWFAKALGFTEEEVKNILRIFVSKEEQIVKDLLPTMRKWYNGYRFQEFSKGTIYNPDMVLYFVKHLHEEKKLPSKLLDTNIASDYSKIRNMFTVGHTTDNHEILRELIENETIIAKVTEEFSLEKEFGYNDFVSLLYYMGFLTIKENFGSLLNFTVPNYVVESLFLEYFLQLLNTNYQLSIKEQLVNSAMLAMAFNNNPNPFFQVIQNILEHLSNRDYQNFSEKYVKVIIMSTALMTDMYYINSEREVRNGYLDIFFQERQSHKVNSQYIFELKYLKKTENSQLNKVKKAAQKQLLAYINKESNLHEIPNLQGWTIVVVKDKMHLEKVY